jgi:hypothetical protein
MNALARWYCRSLLLLALFSFSVSAQDDYAACKDSCYREYASSPDKYEDCVRSCPAASQPACPSEEALNGQARTCKDAGYGYEYYADGQCKYVRCTAPPVTAVPVPAGCEERCKYYYANYPEKHESCLQACEARAEPSAPPARCEDKCRSLYENCAKAGNDPAACKEKYYAPCYRECYPPEEKPEDHSCEYRCRLGYEECAKAGNDPAACKEKFAPCIRACNPPEEKPEDHCEQGCYAVFKACVAAGHSEADCKEKRFGPCLEACHPPGLACGERCKAGYDDCIKAGKDPQACRETASTCIHACSPGEEKECPGREVREVIPEKFPLHFKCYEVEELEGPDSYPTVLVRDQFGNERLKVAKPRLLCTPARKELVRQNAPASLTTATGRAVAITGRQAEDSAGNPDDWSGDSLAVRSGGTGAGREGGAVGLGTLEDGEEDPQDWEGDSLSIRTGGSDDSSSSTGAMVAGVHGLDHMKCYNVEELEGPDSYPDVLVTDQFGKEKLKVVGPALLCTPAKKKIEARDQKDEEKEEKDKDEQEEQEKEERRGCREECMTVYDACLAETGEADQCKKLIQPCLEVCEPVAAGQAPPSGFFRRVLNALFG